MGSRGGGDGRLVVHGPLVLAIVWTGQVNTGPLLAIVASFPTSRSCPAASLPCWPLLAPTRSIRRIAGGWLDRRALRSLTLVQTGRAIQLAQRSHQSARWPVVRWRSLWVAWLLAPASTISAPVDQ